MALEDFDDWVTRADVASSRALLNFEQRMGYEPEVHQIRATRDPHRDLEGLPTPVQALFAELDEIFWPDIWNGYFIGPADEMVRRYRAGTPSRIAVGTDEKPAFVVGSDGGGAYFAVTADSGEVVRVSDATVADGVLRGAVESVAPNLDQFLEELIKGANIVAEGGEPAF